MNCHPGETIVALASPPGVGAVATIRVSGPLTKEIVLPKLRHREEDPFPNRRPVLSHFLDTNRQLLDRVLVTLFPAPYSYTGEDVVEISCHGSVAVTSRIVEEVLGAGARLAEPGEFTMRAFMHGKMDLLQAEAVRDLIESQTRFQAKVATNQLEGKLSRRLEPIKDEVVRILCNVETTLEFVEEGVEVETRERLLVDLEAVDAKLKELEESFPRGKMVVEGTTISIVGKANVGKSTIFNSLIGEDRVIVTEIPGTTRDAVSETVDLKGVPICLVDTAGIRVTTDPIENLGVRKSLEYLKQSGAVLFVVDLSTSFDEEDRRIWELVQDRPCVLVINKQDLVWRSEIPGKVKQRCSAIVQVSALKGVHMESLREALVGLIVPDEEGIMITNIRHKKCIQEARAHLSSGINGYRAGMSEEFPLYDFRKALDALGKLTGEVTTEDILAKIFTTFCIGK